MSLEILVHHTQPQGACYLARHASGYLAGRSPHTARPYPDAQAVYDAFKPLADQGLHWAWNLCYFAEDDIP